MKKVSASVLRPYLVHERGVDQYGFISFNGNYYWTPLGTSGVVRVLEYSDTIVIYYQRKKAASYSLPPFGVKQKKFTPNDIKLEYRPKKRTVSTIDEQNKLKAKGPEVTKYLTQGLDSQGSANQKHRFIRGQQ